MGVVSKTFLKKYVNIIQFFWNYKTSLLRVVLDNKSKLAAIVINIAAYMDPDMIHNNVLITLNDFLVIFTDFLLLNQRNIQYSS